MPEVPAPTGQPAPSPFQPQYSPQPPRPDGPPLPVRGRHGGAPDNQETPRQPRADLNQPGPTRSGPPTGTELPRISDQSRRASDGYGPDMYGNEPPRPNGPRREGTHGRADSGERDTNRDTNRDEVGSRIRGGYGTSGPGADERSGAERGSAERSGAERGGGERGGGERGSAERGGGERGGGTRGSGGSGNIPRSPGLGHGNTSRVGSSAGRGGFGPGHSKPAENNGGGGGRKLLVAGGTVGVVVLALIAYFVTRPSGSSSGPTANATISQISPNPPASSGAASAPASSANASAGAGASGSASPSASGSPTATSAANVVKSEVMRGLQRQRREPARSRRQVPALVTDGFTLATVGGTLAKADTTKVYYPSTRADSATAVASALAIPSADLALSTTYTEVTVVIGTDWASGNTFPAG